MEHLAILSSGWLEKILSGEKTIESRWSKNRIIPYERISEGDVIYFKETGKMVSARAVVEKALFFDNLNESRIRDILRKYGERIGITEYNRNFDGKNFCTLVFLDNVERVEPFKINKKGYGIGSAWITVDSIELKHKKNHYYI